MKQITTQQYINHTAYLVTIFIHKLYSTL